jgi:ATP-binding cassette subfamily F protein 3
VGTAKENKAMIKNDDTSSITATPLAVWTSDSRCTWQGSTLQIRLGLTHAARELYTPSDFTLVSGTITGFVGINGSGKTSTAKVIPHLPGFPANWTVEYLSSEDNQDHTLTKNIDEGGENGTNGDEVLHLSPLIYLERSVENRLEHIRRQIEELEDGIDQEEDQEHVEELVNRLSDLYEMQETMKTAAQREIQQTMHTLGFEPFLQKELRELSAGWRYKTRMLACLLAKPNLLIVDEPSFLDAASTDWLVTRLKEMVDEAQQSSQIFMVLLISHKEALLDALCDRILYLNAETKRISLYHTGYHEFRNVLEAQRTYADKISTESQKQEANAKQSLKSLQKQLHRREQNLKTITSKHADQRFIKGKCKEGKQKADRSMAAKVKHVHKQTAAAEDMLAQVQREKVKPLHIDGTILDGTFATFQEIAFSYEDGVSVFENIDLQLQPTDRVLLKGPNGVGKSTLVKLILGELEATDGSLVRRGKALYFPQGALNDLTREHGHESAFSFLSDHESLTETETRHHLGNFGLAKDLALRPINTLSAGQRVRLWLAKANLKNEKPALLILDEISENVDKETRQSLVDMLHSFAGAVLVISHDQDFCESFHPRQIWTLTRWGLKIDFNDDCLA